MAFHLSVFLSHGLTVCVEEAVTEMQFGAYWGVPELSLLCVEVSF